MRIWLFAFVIVFDWLSVVETEKLFWVLEDKLPSPGNEIPASTDSVIPVFIEEERLRQLGLSSCADLGEKSRLHFMSGVVNISYSY